MAFAASFAGRFSAQELAIVSGSATVKRHRGDAGRPVSVTVTIEPDNAIRAATHIKGDKVAHGVFLAGVEGLRSSILRHRIKMPEGLVWKELCAVDPSTGDDVSLVVDVAVERQDILIWLIAVDRDCPLVDGASQRGRRRRCVPRGHGK